MARRVFICVGHGGSDAGAVGHVVEKDAALVISLAAKAELERSGVTVGISRTRDEEDGLSKEIRMANAFDADLILAVHANAGGGDGFEAYRQTNQFAGESLEIARCIEARVKSMGQYSRGIKTKQGSHGDYFYWLRNANAPTVLLEGFFVDSSDAFDFDSVEEQRALGRIYAYGVLDYLGIKINTLPFMDVNTDDFYYDAIKWASDNHITTGTTATEFSPDEECTRAQAVTMLWRKHGKPEHPGQPLFKDVVPSDYFAKATQWASAEGIVTGVGDNMFEPSAPCTRGQIVTMLYRAAGSPAVAGELPFVDVKADAFYADAVKWAATKGITTGADATHFAPHDPCTRAQLVCFLYRA